MGTMANDVAEYLEGLGLVTFTGANRDVFQAAMDDDPDDAVLLIEGGGQAADRSHDLRRDLNPGLTVVVRAAEDKYNEGYTRAHDIYDALLDFMHTAINGTSYKGTVPVGDISDLGRDERDRWKWSMIFVVKKS